MSTSPQAIIFEATVMFALALTITTILHELAHALAGVALGSQPILHDTFVEHHDLSPGGEALTAVAGPLFSLIQGVLFFLVLPKMHPFSSLAQQFVLWMAIHGLVNFFGYLINAPFAPHGDIGAVARYLELPRTVQFLLLAAGVAANILIGIIATKPLLELAPSPELISASSARMDYVMHAAIAPWLLGAAIVILVRYPPRFAITVIYPAVSGLFAIVSWEHAATLSDVESQAVLANRGALWPWIIVLVLLLVLFRFVLAPGVRLSRAT